MYFIATLFSFSLSPQLTSFGLIGSSLTSASPSLPLSSHFPRSTLFVYHSVASLWPDAGDASLRCVITRPPSLRAILLEYQLYYGNEPNHTRLMFLERTYMHAHTDLLNQGFYVH